MRQAVISGVSWEGPNEVTPMSCLPAVWLSAKLYPSQPWALPRRGRLSPDSLFRVLRNLVIWKVKLDGLLIIRHTHATGLVSQTLEKISLVLVPWLPEGRGWPYLHQLDEENPWVPGNSMGCWGFSDSCIAQKALLTSLDPSGWHDFMVWSLTQQAKHLHKTTGSAAASWSLEPVPAHSFSVWGWGVTCLIAPWFCDPMLTELSIKAGCQTGTLGEVVF